MEDAIKTVVTTFLKSAKGKDNLDSKCFQKLVSKQLGGMMEVRSGIFALYNRCAFFDTTFYFLNIKINKKIAVFFFNHISAYIIFCLHPSTTGHRQLCRHKGDAARAG